MYVAYYTFGLLVRIRLSPSIESVHRFAAAGPVIFVAGVIVHKLLVSRVTGSAAARSIRRPLWQLILTLGVALILQNGGLYVFGSTPVRLLRRLIECLGTGSGLRRCHPIRKSGADCRGVIGVAVLGYRAVHGQVALRQVAACGRRQCRGRIYMGIDVDRAHRLAFGFGVGITAIAAGWLASGGPSSRTSVSST